MMTKRMCHRLVDGLVGGVWLAAALPAATALGAIQWVKFDDLSDGASVAEQYAAQGVHFVNDYAGSGVYRASPTIRATTAAWSDPNILVNEAYDPEIFSSANVPLVIWFNPPVDGVGVRVGLPPGGSPVANAKLTLYGCTGATCSTNVVPTTNFTSAVELWATNLTCLAGPARLLVIDYGGSTVPEAIDDLAFQPSATPCGNLTKPFVDITSHQNLQVVNSSPILLEGTVSNALAVATFLVNGQNAKLTPHTTTNGWLAPYTFRHSLALQPGGNPVTAMAWDISGLTGSESVWLHYGAPASVTLTRFHLTQRGIMQDVACDVDTPLVAGKFTIARIDLFAMTAGGTTTYVDQVEMKLWRKVGGSDVLVDSSWGTSYGTFVSGFKSPSGMTGIHFFIPPDKVSLAGEYRLTFQAYVGLNQLGLPMSPPCTATYFDFQATKPIEVLLIPAEVNLTDPVLGQEHTDAFYTQLDEVIRTYPVRDGWSSIFNPQTNGVKVFAVAPLRFCDGTAATTNSQWCGGTGFEWTFRDTHPAGLWRADHQQVRNPLQPDCVSSNQVGGRVASAALTNLPASAVGLFRGGAHPGDAGGNKPKYYMPFDDDRDGDVDGADLAHYAGEFFDVQSNRWSTTFADYNQGETFRMFRDVNGNRCLDEGSEPETPVITLWRNVGKMMFPATRQALQNFNQQNPSYQMKFGYLAFPDKFNPETPAFGSYGPGGAQGEVAWIRVRPNTVIAHELGHNVGNLGDLYYDSTPEAQRRVPHWLAYAYYEQVTNAVIYDVMWVTVGPNELFFKTNHYATLFNKLKTTGGSSRPAALTATAAFSLSAQLAPDGSLVQPSARLTTAEEFSPADDTSGYRLQLGQGSTVLLDHGIQLAAVFPLEDGLVAPPDFDVTLPLPAGTQWYEVWHGATRLRRVDQSAHAPTVHIVYPNGGQTFGAAENVTVSWTASDADGDPLTYAVLYSPDYGGRWQVLATGLKQTSWQWNTASVPGGAECLIRVVAHDGFNDGQDDSDSNFFVANKPPTASIRQPANSSMFLEGQPIPLRALAHDPEEGNLAVYWDVYGPAGGTDFYELSGLVGPLPPGAYTAELSVMDPDGLHADVSTTFQVLADSDRDGMGDAFEAETGLDPSNAWDALADPDGDGLNNFAESTHKTHPQFWDSDGDGVSDGEEIARGGDPLNPDVFPPPNSCFSAMGINAGSHFGTTTAASNDGSATCGLSTTSPDVWYAYTAPCDGPLSLDTCGSAFDTVLSVHSGCPGSTLTQLGCNDDCGSPDCGLRDSCLSIPVVADQTVFIRVAGYNGATGEYTLNVHFECPPPAPVILAIERVTEEWVYLFFEERGAPAAEYQLWKTSSLDGLWMQDLDAIITPLGGNQHEVWTPTGVPPRQFYSIRAISP